MSPEFLCFSRLSSSLLIFREDGGKELEVGMMFEGVEEGGFGSVGGSMLIFKGGDV